MKNFILTLVFAQLFFHATPQNFENLSFGTDSTFEVMTWNIEWFPKNGQTTVNYVTEIISALDIDLIAIQEVNDTTQFKQMLQNLDNYTGYFKSGWFAGLAYIYKHDVIEVNDIYEIYTTSEYWSIFPRSPMVIDFNFNGQNFIAINNHFKCCGDGWLDYGDSSDEETRRYLATNLLKQYVDDIFPDKRVFILGDLNDIITDEPPNNVFQSILDDTDNYLFADYDIAVGPSSNWSFPSWPSHLDHIIITNLLFEDFYAENTMVEAIKLEEYFSNGWSSYDYNVSDHRPVTIKFTPSFFSSTDKLTNDVTSFYNYPNPFRESTTFVFNQVNINAKFEIFNIAGQKVFSDILGNGQTSLLWNTNGVPSGVYIARLLENKSELAKNKIIVL